MDESARIVYQLHARILKTLAHPKRLMILDSLHSGEMSVSEMTERLDLPQANISQHLAALRSEDLVASRREGNTVFYSLADPKIVQACDIFHEFLAKRMKSNQALAEGFPSVRPFRGADGKSEKKSARL